MVGETINDYKQKIMMKLIEDEELLKALVNTESDFLANPLPIYPEETVYNYIFPYMNTKDIITETKSFITMEFKDFRSVNGNFFSSGEVVFYIICHANLIRTDYGNRYDYILEKIKNAYHGTKFLGIGKTVVTKWGDLSFKEDYFGCYCTVKVYDFNFKQV